MENQNFNNPPQQTPPGGFYQMPPLPNSTAVLVLGILSIVFCWVVGIPGLVMGIIALTMSGKASAIYKQNPGMYSVSSYNNMKAGRICAIIGVVLSALYLVYAIIAIATVGALFSSMPWGHMHRY